MDLAWGQQTLTATVTVLPRIAHSVAIADYITHSELRLSAPLSHLMPLRLAYEGRQRQPATAAGQPASICRIIGGPGGVQIYQSCYINDLAAF